MVSNNFMQQALDLAIEAAAAGEVPVGAVIVHGATGDIIARTANRVERDKNACAHAEILAIQTAMQTMGDGRLADCDLYVTLEPCAMCAGAIAHARIRRLYFGAYDPKGGAIDHGPKLFNQPTIHHQPEIYGGIMEAACGDVLRNFFRGLR